MKYTYADIIIDPQDERLNGAYLLTGIKSM